MGVTASLRQLRSERRSCEYVSSPTPVDDSPLRRVCPCTLDFWIPIYCNAQGGFPRQRGLSAKRTTLPWRENIFHCVESCQGRIDPCSPRENMRPRNRFLIIPSLAGRNQPTSPTPSRPSLFRPENSFQASVTVFALPALSLCGMHRKDRGGPQFRDPAL